MCILIKIWSLVKMLFSALAKEPANNVLDTDIPVDEQSTESTEESNTDNSVSNSNESTDTNVESK